MKRHHTIKNIKFHNKILFINIDGVEYQFPLKSISTKLYNATPDELNKFIISPSGYGIHWPLIDEDISVKGLLKTKLNKSKIKIEV